MAGLALEQLRKTYAGGVEAVRGVSLDVPDGAFCVLVGPSGCGKSTVLRMIAGLETVTSGAITIGSRTVNEVEPADRDIAMVFQNYALYPHMRVYDNLAYGLRNRGTPRPEIETRVREAARMLGLETMLDRYPRQLSGGQRQRVAMGRAIVRKPQVFLFDEPLSNLDAKLRVQMRVEIRRLQRSLGVTTVYVTHDQVEAMTMADRLVVMNGGRIEQVGTPIEIYRRPATRYVATFMGSPPMNILPAEVVPGGVRIEDATIPVATPGLAPGAAVEAGIRPEDLRLAPEGLAFGVAFVEELGATRLLHGRLGGAELVVQVPAGPEPAEGAAIRLAVAPGALHLFDPGTGQRLGMPG
ncbi:sn-glycerol-3-phosphate import ATP-binding protein UgpC [Methylobacterium crusticola]|uniref:Sn-glycerol-3-phosphate import ATP-binding protein UgpC n=1 Tax=Methylobacterium crusticola TaxID=1697972 RepID=A0ABQ4R225_9HYPH|nr:sn-glycerol-3-phosphate ABC transporter ATP-binding protein UgpC [Methylobacterium crusticola]GJD51673.1 sn-glycerol-3-phosphate import ATP-binding protein UgpC [Methylobacterium crusticola]